MDLNAGDCDGTNVNTSSLSLSNFVLSDSLGEFFVDGSEGLI